MIDDQRLINILLYGRHSKSYNKAWEIFNSLDQDYRDDIISALFYAIQYPERLWEVDAIVTNPELQNIEELKGSLERLKTIYEKVSKILGRNRVEVAEDERELITKLLLSHINVLSVDVILAALRSGLDLPEEYCEVLKDHELVYASPTGSGAVGKTLYNRDLLPPKNAAWDVKLGYIGECIRRGDKASFTKIVSLLTDEEKKKLKFENLAEYL